MNELIFIIFLPVATGIFLFLLPDKFRILKSVIALAALAISLVYAVILLFHDNGILSFDLINRLQDKDSLGTGLLNGIGSFLIFNIDNLSKFIVLCAGIMSVLILLYSSGYFSARKQVYHFYSYMLLTHGFTAAAVLAVNFLFFLTCWGILGITLYKLIHSVNQESSATAKKTLIIIGASDGIMILGVVILWKYFGTLSMTGYQADTAVPLYSLAFICLMIGAFTKAGAFPFHTWLPDYAKNAPAASTAYLPASLDKLLGIYFLTRLCTAIFSLSQWITFVLLLLGSVTIIFAVMMALMQHNYKRLLGYHAVSQVGYMIIGLGLGTPLGIAGGLFHMLNNVIYKSGLFMTAGNVEKVTGEENLENLGGLSKTMPLTFFSALIMALAISGVPPLNGFASKWLIYQGIIDFGKLAGFANHLWPVWLGLAVLGSALTLASFLKFISGIFLGAWNEKFLKIHEVPVLMWLPAAVLAMISVVFGVFASSWVIPRIIMTLTGHFEYPGIWDSSLVALMFLVSIGLGVLVFLPGRSKRFRTEDFFIGGESMQTASRFPSVEFYKTIRNFGLFSMIYKQAENKWFDIYDLSKRFILWISAQVSRAHTGILSSYTFWLFIGLVTLMLIFIF